MNNIEKLQNIFQELKKDDESGHSSAYELQWEDIETIENLIQENKELKAKYFCLEQNYFELHNEKISKPIITETEEMLKQYIPKSKVEEKIEEYERKLKQPGVQNINTAAYSYYLGKKEGWEELLEEGE